MEGKWDEAWRAADQADGIFARTLVHKRGVLSVVRTRGLIAYARANEDAAARYFEQLIDCSPRIFPYGPMYGHLGRGELARINRKHSDARYHYGKAIECCLGLHGRIERAYAILGLAEVARQEGGYEDAVHSVLEARNIGRECGYPWLEFYSNLVGSLSTFGTKRAGFLAAAGEFGLRFRRRENDKNLENHIYQQVIKNLASGQAIAPLRFNFP
jgi:tetratricopeptide (TPR) repeat protein